jgi:GNAT superfamily N-acetyltransferase
MDNNENVEYSIEFATKDDISGIIDVYSEWSKFSGILPAALAEPETAKDILQYFDGSNKTRKYLVAKSDAGILGVCYLDVTYIDLQCIRLGSAMVKTQYRGIGIGTKAIQVIIGYAKENKVRKIWFWTQQELSGAIRLYENRGFIAEGKQINQFCNKDALLYGMVLIDNQGFGY